MQRREDKKVKPGHEFDHFFPKAKGGTITVKKGATVADTLKLIPAIVHKTKWQAKRFAFEYVQSESTETTLKKLWQFIYDHIAYKKDEIFKEQVRDFARAWMDRHNTLPNGEKGGVDCDCYSTFISTVLVCLKIKHSFRITKYVDKDQPDKAESEIAYSHIYVIVPKAGGGYWTVDCVVDRFDYEEPYLTKKDTTMDLEYLNGIPDGGIVRTGEANDFLGLMQEQEVMSELGKIFKRKTAAPAGAGSGQKKFATVIKRAASNIKQTTQNVKQKVGKSLHVVNKVNPATVLLRAGILAGMKLNFLKIPESLRYTYLSEEQAKQKGLVLISYQKLKAVREKLEKIFFAAGGQIENLKKAILSGKGNRDKAVPMNGLNGSYYLNEDMSLGEVLGNDMYQQEFLSGLSGYASLAGTSALGELGEPATATSIAAASSVLATIAALIKSAGSLFPKRNKEGKDPVAENQNPESGGGGESNTGANENTGAETPTGEEGGGGEGGESRPAAKTTSSGGDEGGSSENTPPATTETEGQKNAGADATKSQSDTAKKQGTFWENNKKWIKPTGIALGSAGLLGLIYLTFKPKGKQAAMNGTAQKKKPKKQHLLSGLPKGKGKKKKPQEARKSVALL